MVGARRRKAVRAARRRAKRQSRTPWRASAPKRRRARRKRSGARGSPATSDSSTTCTMAGRSPRIRPAPAPASAATSNAAAHARPADWPLRADTSAGRAKGRHRRTPRATSLPASASSAPAGLGPLVGVVIHVGCWICRPQLVRDERRRERRRDRSVEVRPRRVGGALLRPPLRDHQGSTTCSQGWTAGSA